MADPPYGSRIVPRGALGIVSFRWAIGGRQRRTRRGARLRSGVAASAGPAAITPVKWALGRTHLLVSTCLQVDTSELRLPRRVAKRPAQPSAVDRARFSGHLPDTKAEAPDARSGASGKSLL